MTILLPQQEQIQTQAQKFRGVWVRLQAIPWWGQCVALWLGVLIGLTAVGLISVRLLDLREGYDPVIQVSPYGIPGIWARWDSPYYIDLANQGYAALPYAMGYFPLYPLLMRGISQATGLSLAMAGMLISQLSYLAAILVFYKLARLIQNDHGYAMRSVLFMVIFPSSFFFYATYAEPLSLAFSILAVYWVLHSPPNYLRSGLALGVASAARPVGWLLDIVLIAEFIRRRKYNLSNLFSLAVGGLLSISTVVLFVFYLYTLTGSFTAIPEAQAAWLRQWTYPWITIGKSIAIALVGNGVEADWFLYVINWSDLLFTLLAISLTVLAVRWAWQGRYSWSLAIYLVFTLIFLTSNQGLEEVPLWGMTRWVAALFPLYLILGGLGQRSRVAFWLMTVAFSGLQLLFAAWWMSGRWIG